MTFDRRRGELKGSLSAPPTFTQLSTVTTNLLNLTDTTCISSVKTDSSAVFCELFMRTA